MGEKTSFVLFLAGAVAVLVTVGELIRSEPPSERTQRAPVSLDQRYNRPAEAGVAIPVWSDPHARYFLVDLWSPGPGEVYVATVRVGESGTTYSRRIVHCRRNTFTYLGSGDAMAEANHDWPDPVPAERVSRSISDIISEYACEHVPRSTIR